MDKPSYGDSVAGGSDAADDYVYLLGDSTGSLTASGGQGSVSGDLQESDDGTS